MASDPTDEAEATPADTMTDTLDLDLHVDDAVWMKQVGHLKDWCPTTTSIRCALPSRISSKLAAESLRLLFLFKNLQHLDISYYSARSPIEQPVLVACAELLNLTHLSISGGHLHRDGLNLAVLTSLRRLNTLAINPHTDEGLDGLEDAHLASASRLTTLRSLSLRASEDVTDEGFSALNRLTQLTHLRIVPLGLGVSREGLAKVVSSLPSLQTLSVGLLEARQVAALKPLADRLPQVHLVLNSPDTSAASFFSTCTLCLRTSLTSLRMSTFEATDGSFLLAVGTLTCLTELKMGVSLAEGGRPFTVQLAALAPLKPLRALELAVTQELGLPLSVKLVSMLALSWPSLDSLSLSIMTKPEVAPEALGLLDNFRSLKRLSLFAPLDYEAEDDLSAIQLHVNPRYLPRGLQQLVLECALVSEQLATTPIVSAASAPGPMTPQPAGYHVASNGKAELGQRPPSTSGDGAQGAAEPNAVKSPRGSETGSSARPSTDGGPLRPATSMSGAGAGLGGGCGAGNLRMLEEMELSNCTISDTQFGAFVGGAPGLRHLELNDVSGLSDAGLAALSALPRLAHLAVRLPSCPAATHCGLAALRNASCLRHLEWSLSAPLTRRQMDGGQGGGGGALGVLKTLSGLQHLALDVEAELRLGRAGSGAGEGLELVGRSSSGVGAGGVGSRRSQSGDADGEEEQLEPGLAWREQLQAALPLCSVSDRPGIVVYDLWNDKTVYVTGR